ncbi:Phosphatidylglycerol/phosphatidylinositol transfer protein [Sparganum proliferum]
MLLRLLLLSAAIVGALGVSIPDVEDCGSKSGTFSAVDVTPCDSNPCTLYKGSYANLTITFKADHAVKSGKASVHGIIAGVPIPFPIPDNDLCKFASPSCPLDAGTTHTYMYSLEVKKTYPSISLHIRWELKEDDGDFHICVQFPAKLALSTPTSYKPREITRQPKRPYLLDKLREAWKRWFPQFY